MHDVSIFSGSSHPAFAQAVAASIGMEPRPMQRTTFSCGELYIKYDETFRGKPVFLIQTCRTGHMNEDLMELFLMIDAARQSFASRIHVMIPFLAYSRQDKIHAPREGISARLVANLLSHAGADHVVTMHLHSDQTQGFFHCPVDNLHPRKLFVDCLKAKNISDAVVVSPDAGGAKNAKKFADTLGVPLVIMHKQRPKHNESEVTHVIGDVKGKTPIIIDDLVDTAGSVCQAKKALVVNGAKDEVYLCATHAVFSGPARERMDEAGFAEIITTDSLPVENPPQNYHQISVAPLFADVIRNISEQRSVSELHL